MWLRWVLLAGALVLVIAPLSQAFDRNDHYSPRTETNLCILAAVATVPYWAYRRMARRMPRAHDSCAPEPRLALAGVSGTEAAAMTAMAYGLALPPIVLAGGRAGATLAQPMAVVILGGLFTSTLLSLLVLPPLYLRHSRPLAAKTR